MKTTLIKLLARLRRDEKGVTLVEYGIAITLAVAVGTVALTNLGDAVSDKMGEAETALAPTVAGGV